MNDAPTDSMFKLRLPGQLREKLEREAQAKGKTLTAEILERLEDTFSTNPDRIAELEKAVFDGNIGNVRLRKDTQILDERVQDLRMMITDLQKLVSGDSDTPYLKGLRDE